LEIGARMNYLYELSKKLYHVKVVFIHSDDVVDWTGVTCQIGEETKLNKGTYLAYQWDVLALSHPRRR
jgi:hypothetical protein